MVGVWKMAQEEHVRPCHHLLPQYTSALTSHQNLPANTNITSQVVGGTGFIISSWLFMLETQPNWHTPSPKTLGWHIGFWNLIGALGFTLCGALGFASGSSQACETASLWSTFIGSWAFLVRTSRTDAYRPAPFPSSLSSSSRKIYPHVGTGSWPTCLLSPSDREGRSGDP